MAARTTGYPTRRRVNSDRDATHRTRTLFEDGNTVRLLDIFDDPAPVRTKTAPAPRTRSREEMRDHMRAKMRARTRAKARANAWGGQTRAHARTMSAGYVVALTAVCIFTLFLCIHYLQLRSQVIHQNELIAATETTLSRLKADNDAYEHKALASLNMEDVKDTALNKLGLHYATESQIRYYNADDESYVRQYEKIGGG